MSHPEAISGIVLGAASAPPDDELAALDAGWDEVAS